MRILYYCQHVLGVGHFFRTLEICRALADHEVVLVSGGAPVAAALPEHVRCAQLPPLMMDAGFRRVHTVDGQADIAAVRRERRRRLAAIFAREAPGLFLVELYPFGRKAFRFELDPLLADIRRHHPRTRVVCSLRDILVEKSDPAAYEKRVLDTLNASFDALLIHADPRLVRLSETFSRCREIAVPVVYTGFVAPRPSLRARARLRCRLGLGPADRLVVASAGGGSVGAPLLRAAVDAWHRLPADARPCMQVFSGPFMPPGDGACLRSRAGGRLRVKRFSTRFLDWLAAADVSISMAGYNTCMNLLATGVPALVRPFAQNREQRLRAERLERLGALQILADDDLAPARLAERMAGMAATARRAEPPLDLDGAAGTARWIREHIGR